MNSITVSAPGKLMLLGEHAVLYGHPCIVTAVDQRMFVTVQTSDEPFFILNAPDVGIKNYKKQISKLGKSRVEKGAKFVEIALYNFLKNYPQKTGIKITTKSQFSSKFGFGSSSASTVATIFALSRLFNIKLTPKELFDLSYKSVLDIQKKGSGFDVASAIYGGTIYFLTGGKTIKPLMVKNLPLIVGYSQIKADTAAQILKVAQFTQKHSQIVKKTYDLVESLVKNANKAIKTGDFATLGELFNINQGYLESLGVSSSKLSAMIYAAREAGAYGAKLSGAGGGDCMIALAPESKSKGVKNAITKAGGKVINVKTNTQGVKIEK